MKKRIKKKTGTNNFIHLFKVLYLYRLRVIFFVRLALILPSVQKNGVQLQTNAALAKNLTNYTQIWCTKKFTRQ